LKFTHKLRERALECAMNVYGFSIWGLAEFLCVSILFAEAAETFCK